MHLCSNEVFRARTQLAIVDHNHHLQRQQVLTREGPAYHRQWKRRTKEWDVTPRKEKKNYSYVPDIQVLFVCTVCVHVCTDMNIYSCIIYTCTCTSFFRPYLCVG